jgi:hypothetical protein
VARIFRFVDSLGCELHTINDPEDKLPVPEITQVISIGRNRMLVEAVTLHAASSTPRVYSVCVWTVPAGQIM